jgi:acetyl-CoA decarbonylase/synthase complex subunit gamma
MNYKVEPGIYAVGNPGESASVFVTCNFKLTFDHVRKAIDGMDAWLLILDTKGINVWCAAGKGTFSTEQLIYQVNRVDLHRIVNHHRIILPQLGAVGVSAHEVHQQTGFKVMYGPVKAKDISEFMMNGMKATQAMRTITFPVWERIKLIPVELTYGKYYLLLVPALFFLLSGLNMKGYSVDNAYNGGIRATVNLSVAYLAGLVVTPILLPWIPFRRFSLKGLLIGFCAALVMYFFHLSGSNNLEIASWFLIITGLTSFLAMNFTGSSTYTSLSGVQKEMKTAVPLQIIMTGLGLITWLISKFVIL